jgi:hypothetical protein
MLLRLDSVKLIKVLTNEENEFFDFLLKNGPGHLVARLVNLKHADRSGLFKAR